MIRFVQEPKHNTLVIYSRWHDVEYVFDYYYRYYYEYSHNRSPCICVYKIHTCFFFLRFFVLVNMSARRCYFRTTFPIVRGVFIYYLRLRASFRVLVTLGRHNRCIDDICIIIFFRTPFFFIQFRRRHARYFRYLVFFVTFRRLCMRCFGRCIRFRFTRPKQNVVHRFETTRVRRPDKPTNIIPRPLKRYPSVSERVPTASIA